jgi:Domain of unknown function (DUF4157)
VARRLSPIEVGAYNLVPPSIAQRARVVHVPVLAPGSSGMTLGRWILLRSDDRRDGTSKLLAHELVHVRQWRELGLALFLWQYLRAYVANLVRLRGHRQAYRAIPLEVEAYDLADAWATNR